MVSIAGAVSQLEMRRKALEAELASVTSKLKAIQSALDVEQRSESVREPRAAAADDGEKKSTARKQAGRRKTRKLNQWFSSGEAIELMKRHVREPITASEIVKVLARVKGYDKSLAPEQLKRFHGTAYMAVSNAVKAGSATKLKDGRIRIR
jgi:hypothetical protein